VNFHPSRRGSSRTRKRHPGVPNSRPCAAWGRPGTSNPLGDAPGTGYSSLRASVGWIARPHRAGPSAASTPTTVMKRSPCAAARPRRQRSLPLCAVREGVGEGPHLAPHVTCALRQHRTPRHRSCHRLTPAPPVSKISPSRTQPGTGCDRATAVPSMAVLVIIPREEYIRTHGRRR
jgi:hypothetical protein